MTGKDGQVSGWRRVGWLLFSPGKVFPELAARHWLKPALLLAGLNILLAIIIAPKTVAFAAWLVQQGAAQVPPEKLPQVQALAPKAALSGLFLGALVVPWVTWVLVAALLQLFAALSARETSFGALFTVAVYGYLPIFFRTVIANFLLLVTPLANLTTGSQLSLAVFLPPQKSFLYFFLTNCSPFTWWSLILWGIGGAAVMKARPGTVTAYLFALWLLLALALAELSSLASLRSGM